MSDFEKWFKSLNENGRVTYFLGQEGRISEEAWNHQQSKIDELQKQVDAALEITKQGIRKQGGDYYLEKLEQALKGGEE